MTRLEQDAQREADVVDPEWTRWARWRGTVAELLAGGGAFSRHERPIPPVAAAVRSRRERARKEQAR